MVEINRTTSAMIALALFVSYPFVAATFFGFLFTRNSTNFSIYNTGWNGTSTFKEKFQNHPNEGQISTIIGSSNVLNRLNSSEMNDSQGTLIILGPAVHYDFSESLAILMYAINGGRVLIADDFGTANDILSVFSIFLGFMSQINIGELGFGDTGGELNMFGLNTTSNENTSSSPSNFPIAGIAINGSVLADQGSYNNTPLTPVFQSPSTSTQTETSYLMPAPWVTDFTNGLSGRGVIGNFASIITMKVRYPNTTAPGYPETVEWITKWVPMGEFPASASSAFADLGQYDIEIPDVTFSLQIAVLYSSSEAWLESDIAAAKRDVNDISPNTNEWGNPNIGFPVFVYFPFPLGGQIILCSDPSIFINQYLDTTTYPAASQYDNEAFADNVIALMMEDRTGQTIIFDEGHLANHPLSPVLPLSLYLKFLDMVTMFPLFAAGLPIIALILSRRFMPKRTQAKPLLLTRVERYYGRSFFAVKMRWFLEYKQYSRGLELIYRRLRRNIHRRYSHEAELTPEITADYLTKEFPDRFNYKNIADGLRMIENIIVNRTLITEEEFLHHYLFLKTIGTEIA
ncbi:MAG: DUF4350 domain-containing protein [Candidatus Heimdallarchaeota archaeon]|nr:DUF4350 domain-containing protein [Candidatus Heimdallarchaeota archaeon]